MKKIILALLLVLLPCSAIAQEVFVNAGVSADTNTHVARPQWAVTYRQNVGDYAAFSFSYINEGHQPNHYRDGLAAQVWGRVDLFDKKLALALGVGPFGYCDTDVDPGTDTFHDKHGFGLISSFTATLHTKSPLLLQARINYITTSQSFDTVSATFGIGYLFGEPAPGTEPAEKKQTLKNEITVLAGQAVLNSNKSEKDTGMRVEYRRSLFRYLDWTVAWLHEGTSAPFGRTGVTTQAWLVHPFFDDALSLGIGAGPYLAHDKYSGDGEGGTKLAADVGVRVSWRIFNHFALTAMVSRIVTDYSRDTDVFMGGLTYLF
jgi:hypothetical protein